MSFFDRYGLGMQQGGGFNPQAQDPRMQAAAPRMIAPSPGAQGAGGVGYEDLERAIAGSGFLPPLGSTTTPPWNPAPSGGGVSPTAPTGSPAVINGATGAVEPPAIAPTSIPMPEGVTRRDRLMAGFSMMAAAGTPDFSRVAAGVNVGLIEKEKNAEKARQSLMALTKPNIEYGQIGDVQIRKIYDPAYKYDPEASEIQEIPGADLKGPQIEQWTKDGWVTYDPSAGVAKDRETYTDEYGWLRYKDDNTYVNPDAYEPGHAISAEGRLSSQRLLREEYKSDIKPLDDEINQIDLAVTTAAEAYLDPEATKAEKAEADRALIKLVEKLWDPTSAVLGGEFETAQAAQAWLDSVRRAVDPTTAETLGDDKRRALLDILEKVGQEKVNVYNERSSDLTARASSTLQGYRPSQVQGVIDAALPKSWRTDADGNVGEVGTYINRSLDPAWGRLHESGWWNGARDLTDNNNNSGGGGSTTTPTVEEMAKKALEERNRIIALTGAVE